MLRAVRDSTRDATDPVIVGEGEYVPNPVPPGLIKGMGQ
jgi:hypothetical protein